VLLNGHLLIVARYSLASSASSATIARRASLSRLSYDGTAFPLAVTSCPCADFAPLRGHSYALLASTRCDDSGDSNKWRCCVRVQRPGRMAVCEDRIDLAFDMRAHCKQPPFFNVGREQCLACALTMACTGAAVGACPEIKGHWPPPSDAKRYTESNNQENK